MDYKQPSFYKFNSDSIDLVKFVLEQKVKSKRVLDLCAGCGVIGLEYAQSCIQVECLDFVEVQEEFIEFIEYNIEHFNNKKIKTDIFHGAVSQFSSLHKYDLILSNPPYFIKGEGRESQNQLKQLCRTFMIDTAEIYLQKITHLLAKNGKAFILLPNDIKSWGSLIEKYNLQKVENLNRASIYIIESE